MNILSCTFSGIEQLLQVDIPASLKGMDAKICDLAERALVSEFHELEEQYTACRSSINELTGAMPANDVGEF